MYNNVSKRLNKSMEKRFHAKSGSGSFEGWYFKHQIGAMVFSFVVSFHVDEIGEESAYIQFITNEGSYCKRFDIRECYFHGNQFDFKIGSNRFSSEGCRVKLDFDGFEVACNIKYGSFTKLESDIMGPFQFVKNMQCKHVIISMNHDIRGFIDVNGEATELSGGTGYIEGDRGTSFPSEYLWTQTNFQYNGNHSLMLASANIPMGKTSFTGVICQILYRGKQYQIATYRGARILQKSKTSIGIKQGEFRIYAMALDEKGHRLRAPEHGEMVRLVHENPAGRVRYVFYRKDKKIFDFISRCASFEFSNINRIDGGMTDES
ncbi:MAG: tocopherol cyclase family protein [Eubacteriales bacterium]